MKNKKQKIHYIRIEGKYGTIILTLKEYEKGLDRENYGVKKNITNEKDYE